MGKYKKNKKSAKLIVGARSSVFLPFNDLGLIIVDEEHETSYKQQEPSPRYNARDAVIYLSKLNNSKVVLGSATPSIESTNNAKNDKYGYVQLSDRYGKVKMPNIIPLDMRNEPKNTYYVAEFISKLRNISLEMVANQTRDNTLSLFGNMRTN